MKSKTCPPDSLVRWAPFSNPVVHPPETVSPALARAIEDWAFCASNAQPPAVRLAALLEHAAKKHPKRPVPRSVAALIIFGLERAPDLKSPYMDAITRMYRRVDRLLARGGRRLLRLGPYVRASVDHADASQILGPRALGRARAFSRSAIAVMRVCGDELLRDARAVQLLQGMSESLLSPEDRAFRAAFLSAAGAVKSAAMS